MNRTKISVPSAFTGLLKDHRYYVYYGGRGSGKSHSIARYLIAQALAQPIKILCTRELQNSIMESVHSLLVGIISQYRLGKHFSIKNASIEAWNGSQFIFKGLAHNIESVKSTEGIDICWVEEADKVTQYSWDVLIPTIRKPNSKLIISFNPTHEDDPVYQMFVVTGQPHSIVQKVNWSDNPYFPEVLRREMLHLRATNYEKYLHVWEGELRTISDAQIFKGKYIVDDFSSEGVEAFFHGLDFGFADDPMAFVRCFIRDNDLYIDQEVYTYHTELTDMARLIKPALAGIHYKIKADCSRPETISYLKNNPPYFNIEGAKKWDGSVEDGIEFIKSFNRVIIHPRCVKTANEFRRYSYKVDKKTNEILPIPLDDYNHSCDAIRYALDNLIKRKFTIYDAGVV